MQTAIALFRSPDSLIRLSFFCVGFFPIALLATALMGIAPLHGSVFLLFPVLAGAVAIGVESPKHAKMALKGILAGMVATFIYDATRMPFVWLECWPDFIPKIGAALWNSSEGDWLSGYLWRYLGNGGGMGLAFTMIAPWVASRIDVRKGAILYGTAIWCCLLGTLFLCPDAHRMMFDLTPLSFAASLIGHLVYGAVLGLIIYRQHARAARAARVTI